MKTNTNPEAKEATMHNFTLSPLVAIPASGPGALAGFETRCSCGLAIRSSLRELCRQDAYQHMQWHAKKKGGR